MNEAKWNDVAERYLAGTLIPANGVEAWKDAAVEDAIRIRRLLPPDVLSLLEVGCGVGRLTPYLALLFRHVTATDTSFQCRRATSIACAQRGNVTVVAPRSEAADAALVWGNMYDADWTAEHACEHLLALATTCGYVLAQTTRPDVRECWQASASGDDWILIGPMQHWRAT